MSQFGGAKATPYEAHQMLKDKEHLLLFPGGKGEVTTDRSGQKFRLHWREHADYVAMAQVSVCLSISIPAPTCLECVAVSGVGRHCQESAAHGAELGGDRGAVAGDELAVLSWTSTGGQRRRCPWCLVRKKQWDSCGRY